MDTLRRLVTSNAEHPPSYVTPNQLMADSSYVGPCYGAIRI